MLNFVVYTHHIYLSQIQKEFQMSRTKGAKNHVTCLGVEHFNTVRLTVHFVDCPLLNTSEDDPENFTTLGRLKEYVAKSHRTSISAWVAELIRKEINSPIPGDLEYWLECGYQAPVTDKTEPLDLPKEHWKAYRELREYESHDEIVKMFKGLRGFPEKWEAKQTKNKPSEPKFNQKPSLNPRDSAKYDDLIKHHSHEITMKMIESERLNEAEYRLEPLTDDALLELL